MSITIYFCQVGGQRTRLQYFGRTKKSYFIIYHTVFPNGRNKWKIGLYTIAM